MKLSNLDFIKATVERHAKLMTKNISELRDLEKVNLVERVDHIVLNRGEPFDAALERILDKNDLMSINYLQLGLIASKSVCRIHVKNINGGNEGYGTGFLVTNDLILTNNHVFESSEFALYSLAEFNYQYDTNGSPCDSFIFEFDPKKFFHTNKKLDYTLVAIKPKSNVQNKDIREFGYLKLFQEPNKATLGEYVSIIQHPNGSYKQIAIRENKIEGKLDHFITYSTDTAKGSSGSPVFNDQWQVVALHHSGVPKTDDQGNYLCIDGSIYQKGMDDSLIDWISNEGVRISAILRDIKLNENSSCYIDEIFSLPPYQAKSHHQEFAKETNNPNICNYLNSSKTSREFTFTVPIEISVGIGESFQRDSSNSTSYKKDDALQKLPFIIEKANNQNYQGRNGYDSDFVKTTNFKIEINDLLKEQKSVLAPILNPTVENEYVLNYFNFSLAINKHRKLCLMTAVNINGMQLENLKRENTKWILDPRMDAKFQTGPTVYANNDLDRGHMVRRLDPVWGDNAEAANDDTFHFTNSTPQHKNLNQKTWLNLEDYILKSANNESIKVSVFTGPVFSEEDIPYRGVLLPLQFWKVAAMIKSDGTPSVTGYILRQPDDIENFRTTEGIREDGFGKFKTYQVPIQQIANLTGILFDKYNEFDPLQGIDFKEISKLIEIKGEHDIRL